jgi:hypothetical protein
MKKPFALRVSLFAAAAPLAIMGMSRPAGQEASAFTAEKSVDYEFFKTRVEPIFLEKRPGHTRCYVCHLAGRGQNNTAFRLQKLSPGNTFWTEEQSKLNFQNVSALVVPGDPGSSRLLIHPLARGVGGDIYHGGGRQFEARNDPDWLTLAEWIRGQKANGSSAK